MTVSYSLGRLRPALWFGFLLLLLIGIELMITTSVLFSQRPILPYAVTFDLLVGIPALFYWLMVRRYQLPLSSLVGVIGACLALAYWLLPVAQQAPLQALHFLPALLEGTTLLLLVAKGRRLVRSYQQAYQQQPHFWPCAQLTVQQTLGAAGVLLVAEVEMLRYAVLGWWSQPEITPQATVFTSYRDSGFTAFASVLGIALVVETVVVHLLASLWSAHLAGWLLLVDAYTLIMLLAHAHAVRLRPVLLTADTLHLHVGSVWQLTVPVAELVAVVPLRDNPTPAPDLLNLTKLLFTPPNLLLTFSQPVTIKGPYGIQRTGRRLAIYLDQPHQFVEAWKLQ
ncbi:hypothetical protein FNT36_04085 [Hymenobacter setariae]|uniref:Beta-carotene 15,15'-monooxygenase n=1 Tax=Hymenobacter setariae TaxID=2594794 RepID=A0A558C3E4_9BACT|nr:hypothetical protein [Hymenobacter setariae]TVT43276.1 hypothetical protein FNT36_04085 [Hymenobacter setariae]